VPIVNVGQHICQTRCAAASASLLLFDVVRLTIDDSMGSSNAYSVQQGGDKARITGQHSYHGESTISTTTYLTTSPCPRAASRQAFPSTFLVRAAFEHLISRSTAQPARIYLV